MQRLLLDTHAFLWWLSQVSRLTAAARAAIADPRNEVFVSAVSGWEIAVKKAKGKLTAPDNLAAMVDTRGFTHLPLTYHHAEQAAVLPMHHRDPFDRFLVAQSPGRGPHPRHSRPEHPEVRSAYHRRLTRRRERHPRHLGRARQRQPERTSGSDRTATISTRSAQ